jgi:hypothetical protein
MLSRRISLVVLAAAVAGLPACLDADIKTSLAKDGSGTMSVRMGLTEGMVKVLSEMKEIDPDSDLISETNELLFEAPSDEVKAAMKAAGCEVLEFESEQSEAQVSSRVKVAFAHVSKLGELDQIRPEGSDPGGGPGQGMALVRNDDGTYTLSMADGDDDGDDDEFEDENPFEDDGDEVGDGDADGDADETVEVDPEEVMRKAAAAIELMGKVMAEASKLKIVVAMEVPGEIVSHSPEQFAAVDGKSVVWTMDFASMMAGGMQAGGMDGGFSVTFRMPEGESIPRSALTTSALTKGGAKGTGEEKVDSEETK